MKFLVIGKPARTAQFTAKQRLAMMQASKEWQEAYLKNGTVDCAYAFIDGGGFTISNYDTAEDALKAVINFPANALFEWDVKPLADMIKTYDEVISIFKRYAEAEG